MKIAQVRIDAFRQAMDFIRYELGWWAEVCPGSHFITDVEITWGVNWACIGTATAEDTDKYIEQLLKCKQIVAELNTLHIQEDWKNRFDELIPDVDVMKAYIHLLIKYIQAADTAKIEAFFTARNVEEFDDMVLEEE